MHAGGSDDCREAATEDAAERACATAHTETMAAEDDPRTGGPAQPEDTTGDPLPLLIPDDISELEDEVAAYHRELRIAARRARQRARRERAHPLIRWALPVGRPPAPGFSRRGRRLLLPLAMTSGALVLSVVVTILLTVLAPKTDRGVPPLPPLGSPTAAVGQPGGLLPDVVVTDRRGDQVPLRTKRPAVLILLPANCACGDRVNTIADQASSRNLEVIAVTHADASAPPPSAIAAALAVTAYNDPEGQVAQAFGRKDLEAVVVGPDGLVTGIYHRLSGRHLASALPSGLAEQ